ncbi:hypothetical protein [Kushneria aurantia]|uniref:Uncharacterized protein n=1 Tax=Kushneria aurantia TaxID=504092 RepID=A0ABV6G5Q9_9GAMM|nr:hypothetical protein [Kushneria aurantia]
MAIQSSGYIVVRETGIIGVGESITEAAGQALEWLDDYDSVEALVGALEKDVEKAHAADGKPYVRRATARLMEAVEKGGTPEQWTLVDNVACTAEEATRVSR